MGEDRVTILCTGDVHLGRYPSRLPRREDGWSVAHVWQSIVEQAINSEVDIVALTGDVVDRGNRYFEAFGPLESGVRRLGKAGIPTFAVSGNHDFDVLPRLVDAVGAETFHLLGRGGRWESQVFERDGEPVLELMGWSFPNQHFRSSPFADFEGPHTTGVPTVGLLHADLDQPDSPYAPVSSTELEAHSMDAWLLGHIHKPQERRTPSDGIILYPGSPQALDPGERGLHGPWLLEVAPGSSPTARQIPLATVRYLELAVDLSEVDTKEDFERELPEYLRADLREISEGAGALERVVYRLRYVGRTELHRQLTEFSNAMLDDLELTFEGVTCSVDKVEVLTKPRVDLDEIARGHDPPAVLAALLRELRDPELDPGAIPEGQRQLVKRLRRQFADVHTSNAYGPLRANQRTAEAPDNEEIRRLVLAEGMTLLDELLAQKRSLPQKRQEIS
jgi:DNA repair exonuclease SbcCD nuclease subunit